MSWPAVVLNSSTRHTATLVFMHGLGDTGHGWASILHPLLPPGCRLVCPHAQVLPLTVYGGERLPAWFDVLVRTPELARQDPGSVGRARDQLDSLLANEADALSAVRGGGSSGGGRLPLVLGGFSMGGALALYTGLTSQRWRAQLSGLVGLSCYLPLADQLESLTTPSQPSPPPVFVAHGDADEVVRPEMGQAARRLMQERLGVSDLRYRCYSGLEHCAGDQELEDLRGFISDLVSSAGS